MVHELVDKGVIILLCLLSVGIYGPGMEYILALLIAVIIGLSCYLEKITENTWYVLAVMYILSILVFPVNIAFVPLIVYDIVCKKMKYGAYMIVIVYGITAFTQAKSESMMFRGTVCVAAITIVAALLSYRTVCMVDLEARMRKIRDDSIENRLELESRNVELIEKQNSEINVATLKERNRIAREIHDNVGHMLTRAILQVGALKVITHEEVVGEQLEGLGDTLNTAMDNIRSSVHDLHDESVDMGKAIEDVIGRFPGLEVSFNYDVSGNVGNDMKYSFIAIVKEALNNTAKHSNGNKVNIAVTEHPGFYQLVIADNGTDIAENYIGGMGLSSIRERVRTLKGNINISTDKGFRISISVMK